MNVLQDLYYKNVSAGIISALLSLTGPLPVVLLAAANGSFTITQTIHWVFSIYVLAGLFSILLSVYYRMPFPGSNTITGITYLSIVINNYTYQELIGAYVLTGLIFLIIGTSGVFSKLMSYVPKQIISAMLAGMVFKYMVNFIGAVNEMLFIGGLSLLAFFIFYKWKKWIPPSVAAVFTGLILVLLTVPLTGGQLVTGFDFPDFKTPYFSFTSFISLSIPLALLILSNDAAVGLGAMEQNDFHPPVNKAIALCGVFTIVAGFFGGPSVNMGGMMTAICADEEAGPKKSRYMAAVVSGIILLVFGLFSWKLVPFIQALPQTFIALLIGFALLIVFCNSLNSSFANPAMKISTTFAFIIAAANITVFNISSPVLSLLFGTLIARYLENTRPPKNNML